MPNSQTGRKDMSIKVGEKADVLGVKVVSSTLNRVISFLDERIERWSKNPNVKPFFVTTVNVEFVMSAREDKEFAEILDKSDLPLADGFGLRLTNSQIRPVPGRKLVEKLVTSQKYRIFYLGGRGGVAEEMSRNFQIPTSKFQKNKFKTQPKSNKDFQNWDEGSENVKQEYRNSKFETISNDRIVAKINKYQPDILLVAYGAPWQEKWIWHNLDKIRAGVVMGVGGSFDYLTGRASVPPELVSNFGFEWMWRLVKEPWRWRRQLKLVKYIWLLIKK